MDRCDYCGERGHGWEIHSDAWEDVRRAIREDRARDY